MDVILAMKRKYGKTVDDELKLKADMESELDILENSQQRLKNLSSEYNALYKKILKQCRDLSLIRKKWAEFLEKKLMKELNDLNMSKTKFQVSLSNPDHPKAEDFEITGITENGYDTVEFLISPNPGEPVKPLAKIISGGEMSRVMLAFKTILGDLDEIPTMIFDEIDVGISGRTAQKAAEKIGSIASSRQVICVSHLPQIAAMADSVDATVQLHVCGSPIVIAASLQVEAALSNFVIHEHHVTNRSERNIRLGKYDYQPEKGYCSIPELLGIGQELSDWAYEHALATAVVK